MFVIVYFLTAYHASYVGMFVMCLNVSYHMSCPSSSSIMKIKPKAKKIIYLYSHCLVNLLCLKINGLKCYLLLCTHIHTDISVISEAYFFCFWEEKELNSSHKSFGSGAQ